MTTFGRTSKKEEDAVIDPALREVHSPSTASTLKLDKDEMSSPRRPLDPPSPPPPIATISHSPSPSVVSGDRSSTSTPHIRRPSPPPQAMYPPYHQPPHDSRQSSHRGPHGQEHINPYHTGYIYAPPGHFDPHQPRYDGGGHPHHHPHHPHHHPPPPPPQHYHPSGMPPHFAVPPMSHPPNAGYGRQYPLPGQGQVQIVHTDDAATKLTDGIRRRCFNCCTTDTSTWRRSNLSPGKVLCNKCGLFERTHSRPRPDQFPHKRGPLATSALRGRTPPGGPPGSSNQLPPISSATGVPPPGGYVYHPSSDGYHHHQQPLPGLQNWHGSSNGTSGPAMNGGPGGGPSGSNGDRRSDGGSPKLSSGRGGSSGPAGGHSSGNGNGGGRFEEQPLSSNAANDSYSTHKSSRPSSPPASISRSTTNASASAPAPAKEEREATPPAA